MCRPTISPIRPSCIPLAIYRPASCSLGIWRARGCTRLLTRCAPTPILAPPIVGDRHYSIARQVRETLAGYDELQDVIAMLGMEELSQEDQRTINRARRLQRYLTQPFFVTEQFTGRQGRLVSLEAALGGCERILNDEFADVPEQSLYMLGEIDEAE